MAAADGSIIIDVRANTQQATSALTKLAKLAATAFAVDKIIDFSKQAIQLGSDVAEVQNVVDVAFGDMSSAVDEFAQNAITNFGMSELAAKRTASTYMAMARNMGLSQAEAAEMSLTLTGLTGDVESFYNISQELADIKLKSVFTGETETLKDLGIVMTQANLEAFALSQGITKSISAMSQAELVTLRYNFVLDQLSLASGDFIRTQDSWANQTRILSMQWEQFMSIVGQALIQVLLPVVQTLNRIVSALIDMANAFNAAITAIFGGANTEITQTQDNVGGVSSGIGDAVDNQNALTDATKETNKAQKKSIASFDEINKLTGNSASGSGGGTGGAAGGGLAAGTAPIEIATSGEVDPSSSKLLAFFEQLKEAIQPTIDAIGRLWDQLKIVGSFAGDALVDFYESFLVPVGSWIMGEGLPRFIDAVANGLAQINWGRINQALSELWAALAPFAKNVGEGLLWLWENVLVPFGTWTGNNLVPLFIEGIAASLSIFNEIWEAVKPGIEWLWQNFLQPIAEWTGGVIVSVLESIVGALKSFSEWCAENQETISNIATVIASFAAAWAIVNVASLIQGIVTALVTFITTGGLATTVATALGVAINLLTSPITLVTLAIGAIIAVIALLITHWDEVKAAATTACEAIKSAFTGALEAIKGAWENAVEFFSGLWETVKGIFKGAMDFISNTFVSAWNNAWNGVQRTFTAVWNGIVSALETAVNFIIDGINWIISGLNQISFSFPSWVPSVGGKTFGINIPLLDSVKLPRLAQGAVIPPNREFLAVLGDQKQGTNIEAPLSTIEKALENVMNRRGYSGGQVIENVLTLDGEVIYRNQKKTSRQHGISLVNGGNW